MKIIDAKFYLILLLIGCIFEVFQFWQLEHPIFLFLMPPDRMAYFDALSSENKLNFFVMMINQSGNYLHLFFYFYIIEYSPLSPFFTVYLINITLAAILLSVRISSPTVRLIARATFFMYSFGMTKEFFLIILTVRVFSRRSSLLYWPFALARPQMSIFIFLSQFFRKFGYIITSCVALLVFYAAQQIGIFETPEEFLVENEQGELSIIINQLLANPNPLLYLIGLILSTLRLFSEPILGLGNPKLDIYLQFLTFFTFLRMLKYHNNTFYTRSHIKLIILVLGLAVNISFPHFRYLSWALLSYVLILTDTQFIRK